MTRFDWRDWKTLLGNTRRSFVFSGQKYVPQVRQIQRQVQPDRGESTQGGLHQNRQLLRWKILRTTH